MTILVEKGMPRGTSFWPGNRLKSSIWPNRGNGVSKQVPSAPKMVPRACKIEQNAPQMVPKARFEERLHLHMHLHKPPAQCSLGIGHGGGFRSACDNRYIIYLYRQVPESSEGNGAHSPEYLLQSSQSAGPKWYEWYRSLKR